jgi:hypothetical protein
MGTTSSGVLTISVPEGQHRLAVVATQKGWRRHEEALQINAGDQRNIPVELVRASKGAPPTKPDILRPPGSELSHTTEGATSETGGSRTGWRMMFAVSLVAGVVGGGAWIYGYGEIGKAEERQNELCTYSDGMCLLDEGEKELLDDANAKGDRGRLFTAVGISAVSVGVVFGVLSLYKGFLAESERKVVGGHSMRPRRTLTVTPLVSPAGGGATLRLDW